ncbi:MAG: GNAT family N-acetyltransferase [Bacteroidota bacterium]
MIYVHPGEESERLVFGLLEDKYFEAWRGLFIEDEVATFLGMDPNLSPKELARQWFNKIYHRYENDLGGMHVLIDKVSKQFVGQCGILVQEVEEQKRIEIGYSILPQFWGRGYASEAAIKCKELAFQHNYTDNIISVVHIDNKGSAKVAMKNGMSIEKTLDSFKGMPVHIFSVDKEP